MLCFTRLPGAQAREIHEEVLPKKEDLRHHEGEGQEGRQGGHLGHKVSNQAPMLNLSFCKFERAHITVEGALALFFCLLRVVA